MPLYSPDHTGLKPDANPEPVAEEAPKRKRRAKTPEPEATTTEQPVADQPDNPDVG